MKDLIIFILSFFICLSSFAQEREKQYFENNPELGGDVVIKSSSFKAEKDEISKIFEIENLGEGAYYMDAWIMAPLTKEGYPEYKVAVNGALSEFTFKPQINDWQSLALTDAKKSATTVNLKKGINTISVIGKGPEVPNVEFIKLSSSLNRAGISDTNYKKFVESIKSGTLNEVYNSDSEQIASGSRGTNGEIYDYCLNMPVYYTTYLSFYFTAGENVRVAAGLSTRYNIGIIDNTIVPGILDPLEPLYAIELFSTANPESYSWRLEMGFGGTLNAAIPETGSYLIRVRSLKPNYYGTADLSVNGISYSCIFTQSPQLMISSGYPTPANFFTCKIKNGGNTMLWLLDNSEKVRAFNDDAAATSDGYSSGTASRIKTNLTNISYAHVSSVSSNSPVFECDLYGGLTAPESDPNPDHDLLTLFPNLPLDNSFVSAPENYVYCCFSWSVGNTTNWLGCGSTFDLCDNFYDSYGYTNIGATAENAAIAVWTRPHYSPNGYLITHASVRKNSFMPNPHGFEWESKCGGFERIMHTRDALQDLVIYDPMSDFPYGSIARYYRPKTGTVNYSLPGTNPALEIRKSSFSASDLNRVTAMKNQISGTILSDFDSKYRAWENTWSRPEIAIHSNPYLYAESEEYESLLEYCTKYGKAVWPLLIDKLAQSQRDIFVVNLLKDLTYGGNWDFIDDIALAASGETRKFSPFIYSNLVDYCKKLLVKEGANMLKSIQSISTVEDGSFEINISVRGQDILLNLNLVKEEKASVAIYNIFGTLEYEVNYSISKGNQMLVINASNFKKGIYVVQITMESKTISQTISI